MVPFRLRYQGDLRCEALHLPSGSLLTTDAPVDNQGRGERFSPTDLVASGLAACMMTIMGIVARREGIDLGGMSAEVEKHMTERPPRRIARIVVALTLPASVPAQCRAALEQACRHCPVGLSLHPDVEVRLTFAYAP